MKLLMVDNYDSFTYNLVHLFAELGADVIVRRNDAITPDEADELAPTHLVVSPGPGRPEDAGASVAILERLSPRVPTLGVCLGHQALVQLHGGDGRPGARARAREGDDGRARRARDLRRPARGLPRRALPLARGDVGAGRLRGVGDRPRRRGDGRAAPVAPRRRRTVPSRIGADPARPRHREELPRPR